MAAATTRTLQRGDILFAEGEEASDLYIVARGRIAISNRSPDGRESLVALMEPGDLFGEMSLFAGDGRSAEARAPAPSRVVAVPHRPPRALPARRPELLADGPGRLRGAAPPRRT